MGFRFKDPKAKGVRVVLNVSRNRTALTTIGTGVPLGGSQPAFLCFLCKFDPSYPKVNLLGRPRAHGLPFEAGDSQAYARTADAYKPRVTNA